MEKTFNCESGKTLEQVAQSGDRWHIAGNISGQIGWGFGQVEVVPSHSRGVDDLRKSLPTENTI